MRLSSRGVLALIDDAVPGQLHATWTRLCSIDPGTQFVVSAEALFELPEGTLVLYAPDPSKDGATLNLMRPIVADRRYRIVLWCEEGIAEELLRHAPDFFDWITARVDCPWRPMPHALATILAAYRARAAAIVWNGPGIEQTLGWLRPNRRLVRVGVDDYGAIVEAMSEKGPSWLCVENVIDEYDAQRVAWAIIDANRRTPVFTHAAWGVGRLNQPWFEVHALRPSAPLPRSLWLALKSEPTAVQVARQLPVPVPDLAMERALMDADDAGPLYARHIEPAIESPNGWPLWLLRRRPCPLQQPERHSARSGKWPALDAAGRVEVAFDACQFDVAEWTSAAAKELPRWLSAGLAWSAGHPVEGAALIDDSAIESEAASAFATRLARDLERAPAATGDDTLDPDSLREHRGPFDVALMDLFLERAAKRLAASHAKLAELELRAAALIARKLFPDEAHPERAKINFLEAVLRAKQGDLHAAAELAMRARAACCLAYPHEHSSHQAIARLRTEIELRRGDIATWNLYISQPETLDERQTWWLRPAFSLRYAPTR